MSKAHYDNFTLGVFFLSQQNGSLEVWDLLDRSHEPALTQNISSLAITSITPCQITCESPACHVTYAL